LLYKDLVTPVPETLAPTSATWAKKHIFGFSDEDIKLDIQQQRLERAVSAELTNTPTVITKTGLFDNIDKLYKPSVSGDTSTPPAPQPPGGGVTPPLGGASPVGGGGTLPEGKKSNLNIILEDTDRYIDLSKANNSLGSIEEALDNLLND